MNRAKEPSEADLKRSLRKALKTLEATSAELKREQTKSARLLRKCSDSEEKYKRMFTVYHELLARTREVERQNPFPLRVNSASRTYSSNYLLSSASSFFPHRDKYWLKATARKHFRDVAFRFMQAQ